MKSDAQKSSLKSILSDLFKSLIFRLMTQKHIVLVFAAFSAVVAASYAGILAIGYQSQFLGELKETDSVSHKIWNVFAIFVATQIVCELISFLRRFILNKMTLRMAALVKNKIFNRLLKLNVLQMNFENQGQINQYFVSDSLQLANVWAEGLFGFLTTLILAVGVSVFLCLKIGWPGAIFVFVLLLLVYFAQKFAEKSGPYFGMRARFSGARLSEIQEAIRSASTVKMLNLESFFAKRIFAAHAKEEQTRVDLNSIASTYVPFFASLRWIGWAFIVVWVIFGKGRDSEYSGAELVSIIFAVNWFSTLLQESFLFIGLSLNFIQGGTLSASRIDDFLRRTEIPALVGAVSIDSNSTLLLNLKNANFSYHSDKSKSVLKNIDLELKPGMFLGVVGKIGSGKSTLVRALAGEIPVLDGQMRRGSKLKTSVVTQEPFLFSSTLRDTVRFQFDNLANEDEKLKNLFYDTQFMPDFNSLASGFETQVGERGVTLSGGQKMRVTLARSAYYENSNLVLLDDPLSSLDRTTAHEVVRKLLLERWKNKARVLVTHRLEVLEHADEILVLDLGRIADRGTHIELLQRSELYKELYEKSLNA